MTKYKNYLRKRGFWLECDYDVLPTSFGLESVTTKICDFGILITRYYNVLVTRRLITTNGDIIEARDNFDNVERKITQFLLFDEIGGYIFALDENDKIIAIVFNTELYDKLR